MEAKELVLELNTNVSIQVELNLELDESLSEIVVDSNHDIEHENDTHRKLKLIAQLPKANIKIQN